MTKTQSLPAIIDHADPFGVDSTLVRVYRDSDPITNVMTMADATRWLQKHQSMSLDWAVKHEGYSFRALTTADEITHELQDTVDQLHVEKAQREGSTHVWVLESRLLSEPRGTEMMRGLFSHKLGAQASASIAEGVPNTIDWITVNDEQMYADVDSTRWTLSAWPIDKFDGTE